MINYLATGETGPSRTVTSTFDPIDLGAVTAPIRLEFSPTSFGYVTDKVLSPLEVKYYGRRSLGAADVVQTEHSAVSEEGRQHLAPPRACSNARFAPGPTRLTQERGHGAFVFAQLSYARCYTGPWSEWDARRRLAPSAVTLPLLGRVVSPREIVTEQIAATDSNRPPTDALVAAAVVPVMASAGLQIHSDVEGALTGDASAVAALARPLLADSHWPSKVHAGEGEEIVGCLSYSARCLRTMSNGVCTVRSAEIHRPGYSHRQPVTAPAACS